MDSNRKSSPLSFMVLIYTTLFCFDIGQLDSFPMLVDLNRPLKRLLECLVDMVMKKIWRQESI